ncbi:MAG: hypothetical protein ACK56I_10065, partial [bacterium]
PEPLRDAGNARRVAGLDVSSPERGHDRLRHAHPNAFADVHDRHMDAVSGVTRTRNRARQLDESVISSTPTNQRIRAVQGLSQSGCELRRDDLLALVRDEPSERVVVGRSRESCDAKGATVP